MKISLLVISLFLLPLLTAGQQENQYLNGLYRSLSDATSDTVRMTAYRNLALYHFDDDLDSSNFYFENALSVAVRLNLKFEQAYVFNGMGVIQMQQQKFAKSLEFFFKALNLAKDPTIEKTIWDLPPGHNPMSARMLLLSRIYDLIGLLNAYTGKWTVNTKNQLKNYREAEKYAKAAGDRGQIAYVHFHMGIAYKNEGKLDSALMLIKNAIATFSELNDKSGLGRAMIYLGDTHEKMGNFDLAANTIVQAIPLLKETNDQLHLGIAYISLSHVFTDLKKNDSALYYAKESLKIFNKRKDLAWKRDAYDLLTSCFDQLGRTDSAIVYLKLTKSLSDSLSIEERKNLLAFQDVFIDEQSKLEKLEKEKIQTESNIRTYSMIAGLVILSLIGLILYRNNKKEKKAKMVLEKTLIELKSTQSQLIQSEKMASLGELTAGIAHEIQNPLNFVNNFSEVNTELIDELKKELAVGNKQLAEEIVTDIKSNSEKINHHGKRAGNIVKGMLQHSRSSSGVKEPTNINVLCDEYLRLAYHGLRAKDKSFNATMKTEFDETIGIINIVSQDIGRVILNLISNAFYAVNEKYKDESTKLKAEGEESSYAKALKDKYEPTVSVSTRKEGNKVLISVKDNGNGVPDSIKEKIFQPFFTTKPTGQGTGLGLSLSYDIVKAHGGELKVETKVNEESIFIIQLLVS